MKDAVPLPMIDRYHCTECEDCVELCHVGAFAPREARACLTDPQACDSCTDCEAICPAGTIRWPLEIVFEDRATLHWLETSTIIVA